MQPTNVSLPHPEREAYRIEETANVLGISRTLLYRLINEGVVRTVKLGGRRVVPRAEIERLLA